MEWRVNGKGYRVSEDPPKIHVLQRPNFVNSVPAALRELADTLEAKAAAYGPGFVLRVTCVVRASNESPIVYGYGDNPPAQAFMDLHAGAQQLLHMKSPGRT